MVNDEDINGVNMKHATANGDDVADSENPVDGDDGDVVIDDDATEIANENKFIGKTWVASIQN